MAGDWKASGWWRVIAPDGSLWCETSNEAEAREKMREGDILERQFQRVETQWVPIYTKLEDITNGG